MEFTWGILAAVAIVIVALLLLRSRDERVVLSASLKREVTPDDALAADVQALLAQGKRDEALRLVTERGIPREAAATVVDAITKIAAFGNVEVAVTTKTLTVSPDDMADVMRLIKAGQKIEAVKVIREKTGLGLKEAKDVADQLRA